MKAHSISKVALLFCCSLFIKCNDQNNAKGQQKQRNVSSSQDIPYHPLISEKDLDVLINAIGDSRIVMLGEASHGTAEYYTWRAAISKRLIQEKGFDFIAVEGEWADSYRINEFVRGQKRDSASVITLLKQFNRWPTWMWGNYETAALVEWLNAYNQHADTLNHVGFYGLDVYCLWESASQLMPYIEGRDEELVKAAKKAHSCFRPFGSDAQRYALAVARSSSDCRFETNKLWQSIQKITNGNLEHNRPFLLMEQSAAVVLNGERYYRISVTDYSESWNIRDRHMTETLKRLLRFHGAGSKAIVWAHNTHVGDARYTDMIRDKEINIGQLARQELGEQNVYIVGFGSYKGSVIAADAWGAPYKAMNMPQARPGSWEHMLHQQSPSNKIIFSSAIKDVKRLQQPIGHRAIGVTYHPSAEYGNYVPSTIPKRYDAFIFIDETKALRPIPIKLKGNEPPDLYPSGT